MKIIRKKVLDIDKVVIGGLVLATLATGGALASTRANADADNTTVVDEISVVIPVSCSMLGTVTSAHTDTVTAVSYTEDIGVTDLKVTCNDFNGFSIYAVGFTDNTEGTTTMVGANSNLTIPTGVHNEGDTVSSWAMKLTKVTNPGGGSPDVTYNPSILDITNGYSNYNVVPSSLTQVVEYKDNNGGSSATDQSLGAHVQTTYAAYVSGSQAADTYTGQVKYVLVHPANFATGTYNIAYNANGGSGSMTGETSVHNYEPFTLPASTFTPPTGYIFAGWCTVRDQTQNPQTTCTGDSYADQGNIPASTVAAGNPTPTLNLYAYWKVLPTINDLSYMQDFAALSSEEKTSVLNSMTTGVQYQLKDIRGDQKEYYISKLDDGNCWMTENLAIDLSYVDGAGNTVTRTFTSNDTDLNVIYDESTGSYAEYGGDGYTENNGVISWTPKDTAITSTIRGTSAPNWANSTVYPYSAKKEDGPSSGHESLGNYYNWTAAIASNDSTSKNSDTIGNIANNPKNSICPKGWRLPTISNQASTLPGSTNEFGRLNQLYNDGLTSGTGSGTKLMESPLWFVRSGYVYNTSLNSYGSYGGYWSSTVYNSNSAYNLYFSADSVNPALINNRNRGRSVRCVAQ